MLSTQQVPGTNSLLFMKPHVSNVGFRNNPKLLLLCNKPHQNPRGLNSNHILSWFLWVRNQGKALLGNALTVRQGLELEQQEAGMLETGQASLSACSFRVSPPGLLWASSQHGSFRVVVFYMVAPGLLACIFQQTSCSAFYDSLGSHRALLLSYYPVLLI